ncbi:hypothetical protein [Azospirillum argentinense]|uniref:Uncharacterized protein n=1 Tax=Azospirillum brasilense TaxID=192 RepID=A0A4D8QCS0_AZOBR|nr:hypothetical protein [Azospirillum argentinense]QCO03323.1 hypothetical protein D3867_14555 [Azospirillum argentinense]QCO04889.1 hypothetical protein D3867_23830 [Azospirillum argentinense]
MAEQQEEYRGWLIQYDSEGFVASPVPNFDWPECVDPDEWELAQEASWDSPADALRKAQADVDRWWDDRAAEA